MEGCVAEVRLVRGSTVQWATNFYDAGGEIVQPSSATINVVYPIDGGQTASETVTMDAPAGDETRWIGEWDSRVSLAGTIYWSIKSDPGPPMGVEDGQLTLTANPANNATT